MFASFLKVVASIGAVCLCLLAVMWMFFAYTDLHNDGHASLLLPGMGLGALILSVLLIALSVDRLHRRRAIAVTLTIAVSFLLSLVFVYPILDKLIPSNPVESIFYLAVGDAVVVALCAMVVARYTRKLP